MELRRAWERRSGSARAGASGHGIEVSGLVYAWSIYDVNMAIWRCEDGWRMVFPTCSYQFNDSHIKHLLETLCCLTMAWGGDDLFFTRTHVPDINTWACLQKWGVLANVWTIRL